MNANDCSGFEDVGCFLGAAGNWDKFRGKSTYLLVCSRPIGRLEGASDILYIGRSSRFGGDNSSRLWTYSHPDKHAKRVMNVVGNLASDGVTVSLQICQ